MSWENLRDAYRTRLGNLTAKSVLVLIVDDVNAEGLGFIGINRVASLTEVNQRTVLRIAQVFGELDLVTRTEATLKGQLRPAFQVNLARLGLDLREEFARAYRAAQGKAACGKCRRDTRESVAETRRGVAETLESVAETLPPHPLNGGPLLFPLRSPTPQPPPSGGGRARTATLESATEQVCSALGIENRRRRRLIFNALALAGEKGDAPATLALEMIHAVHDQAELHLEGKLRFAFGLQKFLGEGIWRDRSRWAWDTERMRMLAEASVGSRR